MRFRVEYSRRGYWESGVIGGRENSPCPASLCAENVRAFASRGRNWEWQDWERLDAWNNSLENGRIILISPDENLWDGSKSFYEHSFVALRNFLIFEYDTMEISEAETTPSPENDWLTWDILVNEYSSASIKYNRPSAWTSCKKNQFFGGWQADFFRRGSLEWVKMKMKSRLEGECERNVETYLISKAKHRNTLHDGTTSWCCWL